MIQLGCLARFFNRYKNEFKFSKEVNSSSNMWKLRNKWKNIRQVR